MSTPALPLASLVLAAIVASLGVCNRRALAVVAQREVAAFDLGREAGRFGYIPVR